MGVTSPSSVVSRGSSKEDIKQMSIKVRLKPDDKSPETLKNMLLLLLTFQTSSVKLLSYLKWAGPVYPSVNVLLVFPVLACPPFTLQPTF